MQIIERGTLLDRMIQNIRARTAEITYFGPGPVRAILYAVSVELQHLYYKLFQVEQRLDLLTAVGPSLESHAAARGLTRGGGSQASVVLSIRAASAVVVPTGLRISSASGTIFDTAESRTLVPEYAGSSVYVGKLVARSQASGSTQNVPAGSLRQVVNPSVVGGASLTVTNEASAAGGTDTESDLNLRTRTVQRYTALNQGTKAFYEARAREINPRVVRVYVSRGASLNQVKVFCATRTGDTLTLGEKAALEDGLLPFTPVQTFVTVEDMLYQTVSVSFATTITSGASLAQVATDVGLSMVEFLNWSEWPFERAVQADDLIAICSTTAGVDSLQIGSFLPFSDVELPPATLPRLGAVSVINAQDGATITRSDFVNDYPRL